MLVQLKQGERQLKKVEKEKTYNANKISKFIYFFFTLQNKGIPVNEIYEKDGVKFIKTERFQEIMGQNGAGDLDGNQDENEGGTQFSFYSDDSYEYVATHPELAKNSQFRNRHRVRIPQLCFEDLPEYETTDEEEEEQHQEPMTPPHKQQESVGINSPKAVAQMVPYNTGTPNMKENPPGQKAHLQNAAKKPMNQKDYQKSI